VQDSKVPVVITAEDLASEPALILPKQEPQDLLVLHGQSVCSHSETTPSFWKFITGIRGELRDTFKDIMFVGSERDLEVARQFTAWPGATYFSDGGDILLTAEKMASARAVIACGSSMAALAGALKVPSVRVHDPIANNAPKVIWSNLGDSQLNETETTLRTEWPKWRDRWLLTPAVL
jgi:hypothetical protein